MKRLIISIGLALCALFSGFGQEVERTDTLREARIVADRVRRDRAATQTGLQRLDGSILRRGFALFNTPDIIKTLQMMPGVAGGTELMSGLYVHGGDGTDNLFLLDGVPLYQVSHLVGLFSSFNTDLTEEVNFYKSGFPARYGGRMSSVVDVRTREGSFQEYHGTFALGLIDGRIQVEGPIVKDKTSFNIGLRRTWSEVVSIPVLYYVNKKEFEDNGEGKSDKVNASYNFSDFNLKVTHKFSNDNRLSLNLYGGEDRLPITVKTASSTTDAGVEHWGYDSVRGRLQWGNILASLNWQYDITDKLYLETTAYRSKNKNIIGARLSMWDWDGKDVYYNIGEDVRAHTVTTGLTANAYFKPVEAHHIRFGALVQHKGYAPEREYLTESVGRSSDLKFSGKNDVLFKAWESSLYAEDEISVLPWLKANLGVRGALFSVNGKNWAKLEPRASLMFRLGDNSDLKFSYSEMNQFDHSVATTYLDLPTNTWMPSTAVVKPMFSRQIAGGFYTTAASWLKITLEGWYKTMDHLYEYGGPMAIYPPIDSWETLFTEGRGKSWGAEAGFEMEWEKVTAQAYYTLSWSLRKFDDFYFDWYPDRNDNRHKIDLLANWYVSPRFELYAGWHYHTGNKMTAASYVVKGVDDQGTPFARFEIYDRPNSLKLPDYHRLDLGLNFKRSTRRGNESTWNLSIYNVYCRMNAVFAHITDEYEDYITPEGYPNTRPTGRSIGEAFGLIPIIPTFGYTLKF